MRSKQKITAVLHLPESEQGIQLFQEKVKSFYITQVEKKIHSFDLTKEEKLDVISKLIKEYK